MSDINSICEIYYDENSIKEYSTDASIFEVAPSSVAKPKNVEEIKKLVKYASENNIHLTARAAGTCMSGGSLTTGVMVDMKPYFTAIGDVEFDNSIWLEPGVYYRDLDKKTKEKGLIFAPYTSSRELCCIGGMIGNNASGEKSMRYGATIDNVIALKMICSDGEEREFGEITEEELKNKMKQLDFEGELYRKLFELAKNNDELIQSSRPKVRKNAAGFGLWHLWDENKKTFNIAKLLVGSQGTLGIISKAKLKLVPDPKFTQMVVLPIPTLSKLAVAVKEILRHMPEGLETYDSHTYDMAKKYMPDFALAATRADGANLVLFAQFAEDTQEDTRLKAEKCAIDLNNKGFKSIVVMDQSESEAHWQIRRNSYKLLKDHSGEHFKAVPFIEDTIVPIEHYDVFLDKLEKMLEGFKMIYTFAGHIGDGSIRLIPLVDMEAPDSADQVFELARKVYQLTVQFGGSISVDHNDGLIRTTFLNLMYKPEMLELFKQTKEIFDPKGIFNPGKKVDGSVEFSKTHMIRKNL